MPLKLLTLLAALAALGGSALAADPEPDPTPTVQVTWDEAVRMMDRKSPLVKAARAGVDSFRAKLSQAEWARTPTFRVEGGFAAGPEIPALGINLADPDDVIAYLGRIKVQMVQPVWTFGKLDALERAAQRGIEVGHQEVAIAQWELRYRLAQAWYAQLLGAELDDILGEGKKWLDKAEERMARLKAEDSLDYDQMEHLRLKTRVAEFYQLEAENALVVDSAQAGLQKLLQTEPGVRVELSDDTLAPLEYELFELERYLRTARVSEPKLQMARLGHAAKVALADKTNADLWPDIFFLAEASVADTNVSDTEDSAIANDPANQSSIVVLLGFRWYLDVGVRIGKADSARADARKLKYQADTLQDLGDLKVRELYTKLKNARSLIDVYRRSQKAAQGWLNATWDLYDAGFGSFRDVMDALVQFYGKKLTFLKTVHDHNLLVWELSRAVGLDITRMPVLPEPADGAESEAPDAR